MTGGAAHFFAGRRSADWHSAVSPICNRPAARQFFRVRNIAGHAESNSAIQQVGNLRYDQSIRCKRARGARASARANSRIALSPFQAYFLIMSVQEIETAVLGLSPDEFVRFSQWFEEYAADQWDHQIERDILAGRFDAAGKRADAEFAAGRCKPL